MSQYNGFRSINFASAENILEHSASLYSRQNNVKLFNPFFEILKGLMIL